VDFDPALNDDETIINYEVKAYDPSATVQDITNTMIGVTSLIDRVCSAFVMGGSDGSRYKITFKIYTNTGSIREKDVFMRVTDI
jgi:hypothetical protein